MFKHYMMAVAMATLSGLSLFAQSAEEIIRKMDSLQSFTTLYSEGKLITTDTFGEKVTTFKSWSRGTSDFLIELTGGDEAGQKVLRTKDEMYLYYPDAEEIIPLYGAALKQSMFGDISYDDMTEGTDTLSRYSVTILGTEPVDGRDCWKIEMTAKTKNVPWARQVIWVERSTYLLVKGEYYAKSGPALREIRVLETKRIGEKNVMTRMRITNLKKKNSGTEMIITQVKVDVPMDAALFTVNRLQF